MRLLGIGQLAKQVGVGIDTIRYYERSGLLPPSERSPSGYRRYTPMDISRLHFIRRAQLLGFTLLEIKELLALSSQGDVTAVKRSAGIKLAAIDARIADLLRIREGLVTLMEQCSGQDRTEECPLLRALTGVHPK